MKIDDPIRAALDALETPAVAVERAVLDRNIARAAQIARNAGVALRPHVKTHKSLKIAGLQMAGGASGLTVAKPAEAEVFLAGGFRDVTVAYPLLDPRKIGRLIAAAAQAGARLRLVADSAAGVAALAAVAAGAGRDVEVMLEVDVGLKRCGVEPAGEEAQRLAAAIQNHPSLTFAGLLSHAGQAYGAEGPDGVRAVAEAERVAMTGLAGRLREAGIAVPAVSVGSTPTVWLGEHFEGLTEIRPGNCVFMDLTQASLGVAARSDIALSVIASVVSVNDRFAIVDAGSKVLSSDRGPHGSARLNGYGLAAPLDEPSHEMAVVSLSEEHGFLAHEGRPPALGEHVRIWPNHACPVVNLAKNLVIVNADGQTESWSVDARACVL